MAECQDRRIEKMLAAYELGFLTDEERLEVEAHLIKCDACFQRAKDFAPISRLLGNDRQVKESIRDRVREQLASEIAPTKQPDTEAALGRRTRNRLLRIGAVVATVVLILILNLSNLH